MNPNLPDFENSRAAVDEVARIFKRMQKRLPYRWSLEGDKALRRHMKKTGTWLPELEFKLASGMSSDIWEIFSLNLLDQVKPGTYSQAKMMDIFKMVSAYLEKLSLEFQGSKAEHEEFAESLTHGMFLVLQDDLEYLAQPFIFRLCAVWLHSRIMS